MFWILLVMLAILVLAGVVASYVAYPHRGEEMPRLAWLGEAMEHWVKRLPTLENQRSHR